MKWGNYYKFTQHEELKQVLLGTGDREIVEASPRDRVWGVGFGEKNAGKNRGRWGGNLLGKVLMEVREWIRREEAGKKEKGEKAEVNEAPGGGEEGEGEKQNAEVDSAAPVGQEQEQAMDIDMIRRMEKWPLDQ